MYRILLILLAVFMAAYALSVFRFTLKEGVRPDSVSVVWCAYTRVIKALLSGRMNVSYDLALTQCNSDKTY